MDLDTRVTALQVRNVDRNGGPLFNISPLGQHRNVALEAWQKSQENINDEGARNG